MLYTKNGYVTLTLLATELIIMIVFHMINLRRVVKNMGSIIIFRSLNK